MISKILSTCKLKRDADRGRHDDKVKWMKKKYGGEDDSFVVPEEVSEYGGCMIDDVPEESRWEAR